MLLKAGVLDSVPYTVAFTEEQRGFLGFPETGFVNQPVVDAGNILTAQGHAFVDFGLRLAGKLGMPRSSGVLPWSIWGSTKISIGCCWLQSGGVMRRDGYH